MTAFARLVRETPLVWSPRLPGILLKLENQQRTGSFKLRGACRVLDALDAGQRARGVVAASAGNHGMGVALAGRTLGIPVEVYVSSRTPEVKRAGIAALGARIVVQGDSYDEAEAAARARSAGGPVFVSPYDDEEVMLGNGGSLGAELLAQAPDLARVIVPIGGGGMAAGLAEHLVPRGVSLIGVQPSANCAMHESLRLGRALTVYEGGETMAEGCEGAVAERTYVICAKREVGIVLVDEDAIRRAMAFAYRALGQSIEPSAAVALAGVLEGKIEPAAEGATAVVLSGGNVDPEVLSSVLR